MSVRLRMLTSMKCWNACQAGFENSCLRIVLRRERISFDITKIPSKRTNMSMGGRNKTMGSFGFFIII